MLVKVNRTFCVIFLFQITNILGRIGNENVQLNVQIIPKRKNPILIFVIVVTLFLFI